MKQLPETRNESIEVHAWSTPHIGGEYGLRLTLNLKTDEYSARYADSVGARVTVHSRRQIPRPDAYGVDVAPGVETHIGVRVTRVTRLPAPYESNCLSEFPTAYAPFAPVDNEYSEDNCRTACVAVHVLRECQCYLSYDIQRFATPPQGLERPQCTNVTGTARWTSAFFYDL